MPWIYLIITGILEIGWASGIKYTNGFTRLWPSVLTLGCMGVSCSVFPSDHRVAML